MKHSKIAMIGILLSFTLVVSGAAVGQEIENLVTNPDFEVGTEGWTLGSIADGAAGQLMIDKKEKGIVGDVMMAKIDGVGNDAWEPEIHSSSFAVKLGDTMTVSFWAKTEPGVTRTLGVVFEQLDTWQGTGTTFVLNDKWTEYHQSPKMVVSSPPNVIIHIQFNFMKEDVWFSHFRVYKGDWIEEKGLGEKPKLSIAPAGKLAVAWGQVKSR